MSEIRVANASPLITLARVGRLDLLARPEQSVVVPQPVADEILKGPLGDPARVVLERGFCAPYRSVVLDVDVLAWSLGAGESSVLSLPERQVAWPYWMTMKRARLPVHWGSG